MTKHSHSSSAHRPHLKRKSTPADRKAQSQRLGDIVLYGTFGVLMFGPLAFGAVEPWSIFMVEAGAVAMALLWLAKQALDGEISILWNPLYLPVAAFGALIGLQFALGITAYRRDAIQEAMQFCAYALLCFLATQTLLRSSQARKVAVVLAIFGVAVASFALLQGIAPNGKLYWIRQPHLGGWIYGPYVNHNHYAGLMELLAPIPLIIAMSRLAEERGRMIAGISAAIMIGTVFLSGSRGGMIAVFVELVVFAVIVVRRQKRVRIAISVAAFAIVLVGLLTWLGGKELTARVSSISTEAHSELTGGMRLSIGRDALRMFRRKPVLGWGLGSFPVVYPQFRSFYTNFFVNEAHNDYLQLLDEMGMVGFSLMVWFVVLLYRRGVRKIAKWDSEVSGAAALACLLGTTGILVHSFFDFNLQVPANAALFYVMASIAAAPSFLQRARKRPLQTPEEAEAPTLPQTEVV